MFGTIHTINIYYFHKQHKPVGVCNEETVYFEFVIEVLLLLNEFHHLDTSVHPNCDLLFAIKKHPVCNSVSIGPRLCLG